MGTASGMRGIGPAGSAAVLVAACLGLGVGASPDLAAQADDGATVVFLVRHAEKVEDGSSDPALTPAGRARARALAHVLGDAGIRRIHSTGTTRTLDTARPLALGLGVAVERYDGRDLQAIAARLSGSTGRHLVVGHSNTTPQLVELLGGDGGPPIQEAWEYDRLYHVRIGSDGGVETTLLRYGEPSMPGAPSSGEGSPRISSQARSTAVPTPSR